MTTSPSSVTPANPPRFVFEGLDLSYLQLVSNGDKAFEKEMLQSACAEINAKLALLQVSVENDNREGVRLYAHSLKNLTNIAGALSLVQHCEQMEAASESAPGAELAWQLAGIESLWQQAMAQIEKVLAEV